MDSVFLYIQTLLYMYKCTHIKYMLSLNENEGME